MEKFGKKHLSEVKCTTFTLFVVLISAGFGWFRLVYVRGKKLKEAERSEANGVINYFLSNPIYSFSP